VANVTMNENRIPPSVQRKVWNGIVRICVRRAGMERQAVDKQRDGVIEQALPLQYGRRRARQVRSVEHRRSGSGVGRSNDSAERDRRCHWQSGIGNANPRHCSRGQQHRDHGEGEQRQPVAAQCAQRKIVGRIEDRRRDEQGQYKVWLDRDRRRGGQHRHT
jgi:hypothetical protein